MQDPLESMKNWCLTRKNKKVEFISKLVTKMKDFRASNFIGYHELPELVHIDTSTRFILIPGGRYTMGLQPQEHTMLQKITGSVPTPELFQPAHAVEIKPFLCSRSPLLVGLAQEIDEDFEECWVLMDESIKNPDLVPCAMSPDGAKLCAEKLGWRLLSESEWEYVAREGGSVSWICSPNNNRREIEGAVSWALNPIEFNDEALEGGGTNGFGIWGLHLGEFVSDGWHDSYRFAPDDGSSWSPSNGPGVIRGGGAWTFPWQSPQEIIAAYCGNRGPSHCGMGNEIVRFAISLPT